MSEKRVDFFPEKLLKGGLLTLYPTYLEECIDYALSNKVKGIHIDSYFHNMTDDKNLTFFNGLKDITELRIDLSNYEENNLDFLFHLQKLHKLSISINTKTVKNVKGLYSLKNLTELGLLSSRSIINLSELDSIKKLSFHWDSRRIKGVSELPTLQELSIDSFNSKFENFEELPSNENVISLKLFKGNQKSFLNFPKFDKIQTLETDYYSKIERVEGIEKLSSTLKKLQIENSKKILDHNKFGALRKIEKLKMLNCGTISNLAFIQKLKELKELNFYGSNIKNGDLSPILLHPNLESVGFNDRRHYSHKFEEIKNLNE